MNKKEIYFVKYKGDTRYEKVWEQMQLLGIEDISTKRQSDNNTIVWRLPIKDQDSGILIEVASFKSGYVRNQGKSCHSNFQLNKRIDSEPQYYEFGRCHSGNGDKIYRKFTTRTCKLIPREIDRLEYLISYCLKNYYIKHANFVADGEYVPKWMYENTQKSSNLDFNGHRDRIRDLEENLENMTEARDYYKDKLDKAEKNEFYPYSMEIRVNGQRYKVI